jgi:hypothetical protein
MVLVDVGICSLSLWCGRVEPACRWDRVLVVLPGASLC